MRCTERARQALLAWLDSRPARDAQRAIESTGVTSAAAGTLLRTVTEARSSASHVEALVAQARARSARGDDSVEIERWLLISHAIDAIHGDAIQRLGPSAQRLTCDEITALLNDDRTMRGMLEVSGIRFRELAKLVTGRRFCAGLFCWDECGVRRAWLPKIPMRDWGGFCRALVRMGGLAPVTYPHLNPRRESQRIEEPAISQSFAVIAESLERRSDLRGFSAASWLWSPDTHRVSPHLAALNVPILEHGGLVSIVGPAPADCGVFATSVTRRRLYDEGRFTPTVGLVLWPRSEMVAWWRGLARVQAPSIA